MQSLAVILTLLSLHFIDCKQKLFILGLYPNTGTGWTEPFAVYSADLARRHVEESGSILEDYELEIDWQDTECDGGVALQSFFNALANNRNKTYLAVFGGGCAVATSEVAGISYRYGLSQIAYASTATNLGNTRLYPQFVRGVPSDRNAVPARAKFIREQNWKRVAIINEQDPIFVASSHTMETVLDGLGINYRVEDFAPSGLISLEDQVRTIASNLKTFGYRVVIANMYEDAAIKLFCLLDRDNEFLLLPPYTTWIFLGWFTDQWHNKPKVLKEVNCTAEQVAKVSNGALGFLVVHDEDNFKGQNSNSRLTVSNYSASELYQQYKNLTLLGSINETQFNQESDPHEAYVYDSFWTLARSLHQADKNGFNLATISQKEILKDIDFFKAFSAFSQKVYNGMKEQNFSGWSGEVAYIGHERYYNQVQILEFGNGSLINRGNVTNIPKDPAMYTDVDSMEYQVSGFVYWNEGKATDGIETHDIPDSIFGIIFFLSFLMIAYISFYVIFIVIGKIKGWESIKSLSPMLTCIILSGNYFMVLAGIFLISNSRIVRNSQQHFETNVTDEIATTEVCFTHTCNFFCMIMITLLLMASSLIFGGMMARAALIYIVAVKEKIDLSKKHKYAMALSWPFILTIIDLLYILMWSLASPLVVKSEVWPTGLEDPPFFEVIQCQILYQKSSPTIGFIIILIIYKSILVIIGLVMAYNLRCVKREKLQYANTISWTMYNTTFFTLVLILSLSLIQDHDVKIGVVCFLILLTVFLTVTIIGSPPVYYSIKKDKTINESQSVGNISEIVPNKQMFQDQVDSLRKDNRDLEDKNKKMARTLTSSGIDFPCEWDQSSDTIQ